MQASRVGLLVLALLVLGPSGLGADEINECGTIYAFGGCIKFYPLTPPYRSYGLSTSYDRHGQVVRLSGERVACWGDCGPQSPDSCLVDVTVIDCPPHDLGCGIKRGIPDPSLPCCTWESFKYGKVELHARYCQFEDGDTLRVVGHLDYAYSNPICLFSTPSLAEGAVITACADSSVQVAPKTWGRVKAYYH
jgi:hypothetical protein